MTGRSNLISTNFNVFFHPNFRVSSIFNCFNYCY